MLTAEQIQTLHQLYYAERWPIRKIERHLSMGWRTIKKYLQQPDQPAVSRAKPSKLDPFKAAIADLLAQDPTVSSAVIDEAHERTRQKNSWVSVGSGSLPSEW